MMGTLIKYVNWRRDRRTPSVLTGNFVIVKVMFDGAKEYRSSVADDYLNKLLKAIVDACCLNLVADEYGNFVVQKILAYKQFAEYADAIIVNIIRFLFLLLLYSICKLWC